MRLCKTCISKKKINYITSSKSKKKFWKKSFHTKNQFPFNKKPNLNNIKLFYPKKYDLITKINLGTKFKNRYIYYYASNPNNNNYCLNLNKWKKAYNNFENLGISKFNNLGVAILKLKTPQPYIEDNIAYFTHVHFLTTNKNNSDWNETLYTKGIIIDINKKKLNKYISNGCHIILNALSYSDYIKLNIPNSYSLPYKLLNKKINSKDIDNYLYFISKKYYKINIKLNKIKQIPIIVYCYSNKCDASDILINKLWNMGYSNIIKYSGGIKDYFKKH